MRNQKTFLSVAVVLMIALVANANDSRLATSYQQEQEHKRLKNLKKFPKVDESLIRGEWGDGNDGRWMRDGGRWEKDDGRPSFAKGFRLRPEGYAGQDAGQVDDGRGVKDDPATLKNYAEASGRELSVQDENYTPIEIPDGTVINTNTVWDCDVHLLGPVYVENATLIIKPGVKVWLSYDGWGSIVVRNNGVIKAKGAPGQQIVFRSDMGYYFAGYHCAIKIEETASPLCEISHCSIIGALFGIYMENNQLDNPIENNQFWYCYFGIVQHGPMLTDVINNLMIDTYAVGIWAILADANGVASGDAEMLIENNTITGSFWHGWSQDCGIAVFGVNNPDDAGKVVVANNLIAASYFSAIYPAGGWIELSLTCNGYYMNEDNVYVPEGSLPGSGGGMLIENFNSYADEEALHGVWKDWDENGSHAVVYVDTGMASVGMKYHYNNSTAPYYSEAYADTGNLTNEVGSDWTVNDSDMLSLWFYGDRYNDPNERMYIELADGDEYGDFNVVDNFDSYASPYALKDVWKDYWANGTDVVISISDAIIRSGQSMRYEYWNYSEPYYSEAEAGVDDLGMGSSWLGMGAKALTLYFYGQAGNDANEQMYVKLTDGLEYGDVSVIDDFESYANNEALQADWKDSAVNDSGARVYLCVGWGISDSNSMYYSYTDYEQYGYRSEAEATVTALEIGSNWLGMEAKVLSLRFYGYMDNSIEPMYIKLTDGATPAHTAIVPYSGDANDVLEEEWHLWDINVTEFAAANPGFNLANVAKICIGFGDGSAEGSNGYGIVFFDDIQLYRGYLKRPSTAKVVYAGDANDVRQEWWHSWDINLAEFTVDNPGFNLDNVTKIAIGFEGGPPGDGTSEVYFDDIRLYLDYPQHPHRVMVEYDGDMNDVRREVWQQWRVPLAEFNDVNLANVARIGIGFGDKNPEGSNGDGTVYFDEIRLFSGVSEEPMVFPGDVVLTEDPFVYGYYDYPFFLKQDCNLIDAGYKYVDETRLAGRSSDVNWSPDSNMVDIGFHYINWSYVGTGGIRRSADFNGDFMVDFNDLEFLVDYWLYDYQLGQDTWWWNCVEDGRIDYKDLALVFSYWPDYFSFVEFADFAQYWMRDADTKFLNKRPDLNKDGYVNFADFAILASQWYPSQPEEPNVQMQIIGDGNNGFVEIGVSGYTSDTQRIFLLIDGQHVGEIFGFREGEPLGIDISEYSDGPHQLKAISIDSAGRVTCSKITNVEFSCPLNYCLLPSSYEPNKPLCFSAFNNSGEDVTVNVYADCGNLVWSQIYSGDSFFDSIPAEITGQHEIDYVSFDTGGGSTMLTTSGPASPTGYAAASESGGGSIRKVSDPAESGPQGDVRALIILPDFLVRLYDFESIMAVQKAFKDRHIKYKKLAGRSASYDTLAFYAATNPIKYMYVGAHGGFGRSPKTGENCFGGELRTWVGLSDGHVVSIKESDFADPNYAPSWCENLGDYWENPKSPGRLKSFYSMGFTNLEFVFSNACYGGRLTINGNDELVEGRPGQEGVVLDAPVSDMSIALGMHEPTQNRFYLGWYDKSTSEIWPFRTDCQKWTQDMWEALGNEDNLQMAIMYAISQQTNLSDPNNPANAYRLKGQEFLWEIFLRNN